MDIRRLNLTELDKDLSEEERVTYSELFLLLTLIVSIIALVYNITKKK